MKKVLITMAVLTGMVAGGMVLSSFMAPKTNDEIEYSQISVNDGWRMVGVYTGKADGIRDSEQFVVWEKDGMCNAYYWVLKDSTGHDKNPDETNSSTGALRKDREGRWYCAYYGNNYYIDF